MMLIMVRSGVISDQLWAVLEPVLPSGAGRQGRPWRDHRWVLEGICWRFRTGAPWRDVPAEFGPWQTLWKRHRRWSEDGTYEKMRVAAQAVDPEVAAVDGVRQLLGVDSSVVRAHQHAAGARRVTGGWIELQETARRA